MAYTTIDDPSAYFQTKLYSGTGSSNSVTNDGNSDLQPDWVWIKERNNAVSHRIFDSSRGVQKRIFSNNTDAESTQSNSLTAFNSDGFTVGDSGSVNGGSDTYVAWQWKANGGTTSTLSGGISAIVQANTTAGFSIVKFTASGNNNQVEHGLGAVPHFIIAKGKDVSDNWFIYHKSIGPNGYIMLNQSSATDSPNSTVWRNIDPTSQYFYVSSGGFNDDSTDVIAYCFAEKQGYSKFGSYTGNGNSDGPFVYTGFKPAWIMQKNTADSTNWNIYDNKRSTFNKADDVLLANANIAEGAVSGKSIDFLSNGFKLRGSDNETNDSGDVHIYMAFAEHPFVSSEGVPTTAR